MSQNEHYFHAFKYSKRTLEAVEQIASDKSLSDEDKIEELKAYMRKRREDWQTYSRVAAES